MKIRTEVFELMKALLLIAQSGRKSPKSRKKLKKAKKMVKKILKSFGKIGKRAKAKMKRYLKGGKFSKLGRKSMWFHVLEEGLELIQVLLFEPKNKKHRKEEKADLQAMFTLLF